VAKKESIQTFTRHLSIMIFQNQTTS
jgi:hypothetical protein